MDDNITFHQIYYWWFSAGKHNYLLQTTGAMCSIKTIAYENYFKNISGSCYSCFFFFLFLHWIQMQINKCIYTLIYSKIIKFLVNFFIGLILLIKLIKQINFKNINIIGTFIWRLKYYVCRYYY